MKADGSEALANVSISQHFATFPNGNQRYEIVGGRSRGFLSEREPGTVAQCFIPAMMNVGAIEVVVSHLGAPVSTSGPPMVYGFAKINGSLLPVCPRRSAFTFSDN